MFELDYYERKELEYEARHGDEWSQHILCDYYDQFDEIPDDDELGYWGCLYRDTYNWMYFFRETDDTDQPDECVTGYIFF